MQFCIFLRLWDDNAVYPSFYWHSKFFCVLSNVLQTHCLLTTERMLTIMSVEYYIALKYFIILFIHVSHNIVCWLLTYADNNVYWVLYCYEIFLLLYRWEPQYCLMTTDVCWQYCLLSTIAMKYFIFDSLTTTQQCYYYHSNQQLPS